MAEESINYIMKDAEEVKSLNRVEIKYVLCFPPGKMPAGNFFERLWNMLRWKPSVAYSYEYRAMNGEKKICLFMKDYPLTSHRNVLLRFLLKRRMQQFSLKLGESAGEIHEMEDGQDYPYSLRIYAAKEFLEKINIGKRTRIGVIEGSALKRRDLIALLRQKYEQMNYLTIFTKEADAYRELAEDAWEQLGLAVTITSSLRELELCDCILDCTRLPFDGKLKCKQGCFFFSLYTDQQKIKRIRGGGAGLHYDSCRSVLDRAFDNKV